MNAQEDDQAAWWPANKIAALAAVSLSAIGIVVFFGCATVLGISGLREVMQPCRAEFAG